MEKIKKEAIMEFSELEIQMFSKAREIQESWVPKRGDWFYKEDGLGQGTWLIATIIGNTLFCAGERMKIPAFKNRLVEFRNPQNYTWIPSVEDLWAMMAGWTFNIEPGVYRPSEFKLMLLSVAMRELYGRKWKNNTWKKILKKKSDTIKTE